MNDNYGMPDGWVDLAAYMYVTNSLAADAAASRRAYWASVDEAERRTLINSFNNYRLRMNDNAARQNAEKDFFAGRRDRMVGYFRKAPGYKWRWTLPIALAIFCGFDAATETRPAEHLVFFCLAFIFLWLARVVRNVFIPGYADAFLAQEIAQARYDNDVAAFQQANGGYTQVGW